MKNFLHTARDHLSDLSLVKTNRTLDEVDQVKDIYISGVEKFQSLIANKAHSDKGSRFNWGFLEAEIDHVDESALQEDDE